MYTLYYAPGTCSLAVHVLMNELGVDFDAQKVTIHGTKSPALISVNPRGSVPVITDDGMPIREGGAILTYLADKHKSPLLPQSGKERAAALEWLMFCNATLHPAYSKAFGSKAYEDKNVQEAVLNSAKNQIEKYWVEIEKRLGETKFLAGNEPTVGDILLTVISAWKPNGHAFNFGPNTQRLLKDIQSRPAYQKALDRESSAQAA